MLGGTILKKVDIDAQRHQGHKIMVNIETMTGSKLSR